MSSPSAARSNWNGIPLSFFFISGIHIVSIFLYWSHSSWALSIWTMVTGGILGYALFSSEIGLFDVLLRDLVQNHDKSSQVVFSETDSPQPVQCGVCREFSCQRHREGGLLAARPWEGLFIPESVDVGLTKMFETLLQKHVFIWYRMLSDNELVFGDIRTCLRFFAARLARNFMKVDVVRVTMERLVPVMSRHLDVLITTKSSIQGYQTIRLGKELIERLGTHAHCTTRSQAAETDYLRKLTERLLRIHLPPDVTCCRPFVILLREAVVKFFWVPLLEILTDPDFINNLLVTALKDSEPEPVSVPGAKVVFLERFASASVLAPQHELSFPHLDLMHTSRLLFPYISYLRREGGINVLQFCLTVEDFTKRILSIEAQHGVAINSEATKIYKDFFDPESPDKIPFPSSILESFSEVIQIPIESSDERLRLAPILFKAYEHASSLLENSFYPGFDQSEEFFGLLCGNRSKYTNLKTLPSDSNVKVCSEPCIIDRGTGAVALEKLSNEIKSTDQGYISKSPDEADQTELTLKKLHGHSHPESVSEGEEAFFLPHDLSDVSTLDLDFDLSSLVVEVPKIQKVWNRNKGVYHYLITTNRSGVPSSKILRKYSEFYELESRLKRFHEGRILTELPPKRMLLKKDFPYLESCRLQFQHYLQVLTKDSLLRRSKLLQSFLSQDSKFKNFFEPNSVSRQAGQKLQTMTSRLYIERGQNLEGFLNYLVSNTEQPKSKHNCRCLNDGISWLASLRQELAAADQPIPEYRKRVISEDGCRHLPSAFAGTALIQFLGSRLFRIHPLKQMLLSLILPVFNLSISTNISGYLRASFDCLFSEFNLTKLIETIHEAIFDSERVPRTDQDKIETREQLRGLLTTLFPDSIQVIIGRDHFSDGINTLLELFQLPEYNRQMVFVLLDELLSILAPEVDKVDDTEGA